jgi:hypothetical protein
VTTSFYAVGESGPASAYYRFGGFAETGIQPDEVLLRHVACRTHRFLSDFNGCTAACAVAPEEFWDLKVFKNGVQAGTITFDPTGAPSFSTVGGFQLLMVPGDVLTVQAPTLADPSIRGVAFTFSGEITD